MDSVIALTAATRLQPMLVTLAFLSARMSLIWMGILTELI